MDSSYQRIQDVFKQSILLLFACAAVFAVFVPLVHAQTAQLELSPGSLIRTVDETFRVKVLIDSEDAAINAAEGVIVFDNSRISIESISTQGSIFPIWTQTPSVSDGRIEFSGGTRDGYQGDVGSLFTLTVRPLKAGEADMSFNEGAVLAADGSGSNILSQMLGGTYTILARDIRPDAEYVVPDNAPRAPEVTSTTHPDEDAWYATSTAALSWDLPNDITSVRYAVTDSPHTVPDTVAQRLISSYRIRGLSDGPQYFHLQLQNEYGWGGIAHYRLQTDTAPPEYFNIVEEERDDTTDPRISVFFDALDGVSGISEFVVQVNDDPPKTIEDDGSRIYQLPLLQPGDHRVHVRAIDEAGNEASDTWNFTIDALEPPVLTEYPEVLGNNETLIVEGLTFPDTEVTIYLKQGQEPARQFTTVSDEKGNFTYIAEQQPEDGVYQLWAEVQNSKGARSVPSRKITVAVQPPILFEIGSLAVTALSVFVPLIALLIVLGMLVAYIWHRVRRYRRLVKRETGEATEALHKAFDRMRKEAKSAIRDIEDAEVSRELTKEEKRSLKKLRRSLDEAERMVAEEIEDIEEIRW